MADYQRIAAAIVSGALLTTAACTGEASSVKSGGPVPATVLVLASNDIQALAPTSPVRHFVDQVDDISDGRLVIDVEEGWEGGNDEVNVIGDVAAGDADLGWSGTRALDVLGVDGLRPLSLPYLVDNYALQAAVVSQGQDRLLADLDRAGITPLALAADDMRFPAALAAPLLSPSDWRGVDVRTFESEQQEAAISAMGATPVVTADLMAGLDDGSVGAAEVSWPLYLNQHVVNTAPYVTPNAALWPRTVVIFGNPGSLGALTGDERAWLAEAATDTVDWSIEHAGSGDQELLERACKLGARVATATPQELEALRAASEPVYEQLRAVADEAATIDWIEGLAADVPATPPLDVPSDCAYVPGEPPPVAALEPLAEPGPTGQFPRGTYRFTLTVDYLESIKAYQYNAIENAAVYTWTFGAGVFELTWQTTEVDIPSYVCRGLYSVTGRAVHLTRTVDMPGGDCLPPDWTAEWRAVDGGIEWSEVRTSPPAYADFGPVFAGFTWNRID